MSNDYYTPTGAPGAKSFQSSAAVRGEFTSLQAAFDKLPGLAANPGKILRVNAGGTALTADVAFTSSGVWTPEFSFATPGTFSAGYDFQFGNYARIGNLVYFDFYIFTNAFSKGSASGALRITGLPFSPTTDYCGFQPTGISGITTGVVGNIYGVVRSNYLEFQVNPTAGVGGTHSSITASATFATPSLQGGGVYYTP